MYTFCAHMLIPAAAKSPLRCRTVNQMPIYDQLRGERINADVPASRSSDADQLPVDHCGKHHLLADPPVPAAVFGPGPRADPAPRLPDPVAASPTGQSASDRQRSAAQWGPRAAAPREIYARQGQSPGSYSTSVPAADHKLAHEAAISAQFSWFGGAQDAAAGVEMRR